jgi:hypothetical protein
MLDTDFASEYLTCPEGADLSDDTRARRQAAETGKNSWRVVGHEWRSVDISNLISIHPDLLTNDMQYVAFLRFLSLRAKKELGDDGLGEEEDGGASELPRKHLRTTATTKTKVVKRHFDTAPSKMNSDVPASRKKTIPFQSMVSPSWAHSHPMMKVLDGGAWLDDFYGRAKPTDFFLEEVAYLKELCEHHKKLEEFQAVKAQEAQVEAQVEEAEGVTGQENEAAGENVVGESG